MLDQVSGGGGKCNIKLANKEFIDAGAFSPCIKALTRRWYYHSVMITFESLEKVLTYFN